MKKTVSLLLVLLLVLPLCPAGAEELFAFYDRPSDVYAPDIAQQALSVAILAYKPMPLLILMSTMGYYKVGEFNMNRAPGDTRHTVGYSVYQKALEDGRTAVVFSIRGTVEEEWPLNMDLMPSGDYGAAIAENFALAAQDILNTNEAYLSGLENPVFFVTGHSRGAAVTNILSARLTDRFGADRVYAYAFACPRTVRGDVPDYGNIFNIINPCDIVTYVPFPQWGFVRYGRDMILPVEDSTDAEWEAVLAAYQLRVDKLGEDITLVLPSALIRDWTEAVTQALPTVEASYTYRHALTHPGEAAEGEEGSTGMELLLDHLTSLLSASEETILAHLAPFQAAENDFAPIANAVLAMLQAADPLAIRSAHMPATYGAWLTVLKP